MSYSATILAEASLLNYWRFEGSADGSDSKGSNTATITGGVTTGVTGGVDGGKCAQFNGSTGFMSVSPTITGDFTIEFCVKLASGASLPGGGSFYTGWGLVNAEMPGVTNDLGTSISTSGISAGTGNPDTSISSVTVGLSVNYAAWLHVAFTRTQASGALNLYIGGNLCASGTGGIQLLNAPTRICFGQIQTGGGFLNGYLDEVAFYSTALSAASVLAHAQAATPSLRIIPVSYSGPMPQPTVATHSSLPFPSPGLRTHAPAFLTGGAPVIFVLDPVLPQGLVGYAYSQTLIAGGGTAPYTLAVTSGALPGGLTLNSTTGALTGTPSVAGSFSFTVRATDAQPMTGSQAFTLAIGGPVVMGGANSGYTG